MVSEVPLVGRTVAEDVSVTVTGSFGLVVKSGGVDVGESEETVGTLFES